MASPTSADPAAAEVVAAAASSFGNAEQDASVAVGSVNLATVNMDSTSPPSQIDSTDPSSQPATPEKPKRSEHDPEDSIPTSTAAAASAAPSSAPYAIASGPSITETTLVPPPPPRGDPSSTTSPLTTIESSSIPILPSSSSVHPPTTTSLSITLLLLSSVRYPFVIDSEYLSRHNVTLPDHDPMQMTVSALKECIWKEWRDDWDTKPPSANFIRLIHFGQLLADRQLLKDCRLNPDTPNVVHMNARPAELGDDDTTQRSAAKLGFSRGNRERSESGASPTCRCVIL